MTFTGDRVGEEPGSKLDTNNLIWCLMGILVSFSFLILINSSKAMALLLELKVRETVSLMAKFKIISVFSLLAGCVIAFLLFPANLSMLQFTLFLSFALMFFTGVPLIVVLTDSVSSKISLRIFYLLVMSGTCLTIGFIKMITIASVNDLFVAGNAVNKVLFLLVGNSLGAFLVHCITPFLDFSNRPLFMDTCGNGTHSLSPGKINAIRSQAIAILCYKLIIVLILTLLVSWAVLCYTNLHKEHRKWMKFNVTQANFVVKALNITLEQYPYVILLVLVELLHTIFKFLAVSYVMGGEPFNPIWLSLLLLMISDFFEVFGKFIPHLTNKVFNRQPVSTLIHTNNTPNTIHTVNIGNIGNTGNTTETTVTTENNDNTTENTDTGNRISSCGRVLRSLNGPLSMLFVLVAVEFMMIVMMFVEISFPHRPLSVNFLKFSSGVFITAFFSALRGCCVSVVYCRLCNVQVNRGLIEEVLEPKETKIVKSFLIGLFCIIEVVPGVVWYLAEPRVIPTLYIFIQRVRSQ